MTRNICLIPARSGSKRLPNKNVLAFHGKPLIAWSITTALQSELFDAVIVSTDSDHIASIAKQFGASVPFLRKPELADDLSTDFDVRNDFRDWLLREDYSYDHLCYLYPTAPFITVKTLSQALETVSSSPSISVQTVTHYCYPPQRSLSIDSGVLRFSNPEYSSTRSQDLPELYRDAAQCYFFKSSDLMESYPRIPLMINRIFAPDIDDLVDFQIAEAIFSKLSPESIINRTENYF